MSKTLFEYVLVRKWTYKKVEYQEILQEGKLFANTKEDVEKEVIRLDVALDYDVDELVVLVRPFS